VKEECAKECIALTTAGTNCVLFNAYERFVNGKSEGSICAFFDAVEPIEKATNAGEEGVAFRDSTAWAVFDHQLYMEHL
jgi:hypothetical protein